MYVASECGHLDVVRELLARGASIDAANGGCTSLYVASENGHVDILRELLDRGANVEAATADDSFTPLITASFFGHVDVVHALLAAGANKHHVDNNGDTATSCAGAGDDVEPAAKATVLALLAAAP